MWSVVHVALVLTQSDDVVSQPEGTGAVAADEVHSRVRELDEKVKDLELKVANLFMDNIALKTKLTASWEVEGQLQKEVTGLRERLVQALSAQVNRCLHYKHDQYLADLNLQAYILSRIMLIFSVAV